MNYVLEILLGTALTLAPQEAAPPSPPAAPPPPTEARPGSDLDLTRATLEKWVEVRQQTARARTDWEADRETLQAMSALLEREFRAIVDQAGKLNTNTVQVEQERRQAQESLQASQDYLERVRQFAAAFEGQLAQFVPRLPQPLQELLTPFLNRLPADPANTKLTPAERTQVLVAILNELDKFNNGLTIASEKRKSNSGEEIAVETVYLGLGAAYFVNDAGDFAGFGAPGASGWEWTARPELAGSVREVIRIYRNERPARFLSLPATLR